MLVLWFCATIIQAQNIKEFPVLKGDYLGQTTPGNIPVVFAPNLISGKGRLHACLLFHLIIMNFIADFTPSNNANKTN